jgi:hypothetical protein
VWIGAEPIKGLRFPLFTGWAIEPTKIVTTATAVQLLDEFLSAGEPAFVYCPNVSDPFVPISGTELHPLFDEGSSERGRHFNVGIVHVETAVPSQCVVASEQTVDRTNTGTELVALGFAMQKRPDPVPFDRQHAPELTAVSVEVLATMFCTEHPDSFPRMTVDAALPDGLDGAPVFATSGEVVGVGWQVGDTTFVLSARHVDDILKGANQ